jgi:opacity protein-like surface antigen
MRKLFALGLLLTVTTPALAQPPPPPPPAGGTTGYESPEPKMRLDVGLIAGLPQGDFGDGVETSPGINIDFGYTVVPNVSVFGGIRYFSVQLEGGTGDAEIGSYDFHFGGRYSIPVSPTAKVFGEGYLQYATLSISEGGFEVSESGVGFGARGGAMFNVSGNISIGGALSFSTATIEEFDAAWLGIEGFVSFGF